MAVIFSIFVFAGVGQLYNKQYKKGILIMIAFSILVFLSSRPIVLSYVDYLNTAANVENIDLSKVDVVKPNTIVTMLMTIVWLFAIVDSYISAKKYNIEIEKENTEKI